MNGMGGSHITRVVNEEYNKLVNHTPSDFADGALRLLGSVGVIMEASRVLDELVTADEVEVKDILVPKSSTTTKYYRYAEGATEH